MKLCLWNSMSSQMLHPGCSRTDLSAGDGPVVGYATCPTNVPSGPLIDARLLASRQPVVLTDLPIAAGLVNNTHRPIQYLELFFVLARPYAVV